MKRFLPAIASALLLVLFSYWGQEYFRGHFRLTLLFSLSVFYILLSLYAATMKWRGDRVIDETDPETLRHLAEHNPAIAEHLAHRERTTQVRDWHWALTWGASAIISLIAVPVTFPWLRGESLSGDGRVRGLDVLGLVACVGIYFYLHHRALTHYRCLRCDAETEPLKGERSRRSCTRCGRVWLLQP